MANEPRESNTQSKTQTATQSGSQTGVERRREGQGGSVARRAMGFDPFLFSPSEFFRNPFSMMRRMQQEMDRMLAESFGQGERGGGGARGAMSLWSPAVEISEDEKQLRICADLPGMKPEDVKVEVEEGAIVIQGERKHEQEGKEGGRWHSERSYGQFYRAIPLPEGANPDQAKADFQNGELRITVPVERPQSKRRQIEVKSEGGKS